MRVDGGAVWRLVQQHMGKGFLGCFALETKVMHTIVDFRELIPQRNACAIEFVKV
jgi:hypothetical protein